MIYIASSWRNTYYSAVVDCFKQWSIPVYDFRSHSPFHFKEVSPSWHEWDRAEYLGNLSHPLVEEGFTRDLNALNNCAGLLMVTPCGKSAHLELGYIAGAGKPTAIYLTEKQEPELMYKLTDVILTEIEAVHGWARGVMQDLAGLPRIAPESPGAVG